MKGRHENDAETVKTGRWYSMKIIFTLLAGVVILHTPAFAGRSLRTDRHRYTEWQDQKSGQVVARELYDHENDPGETTNLADKNPDVVKRLSETLAAWTATLPKSYGKTDEQED